MVDETAGFELNRFLMILARFAKEPIRKKGHS